MVKNLLAEMQRLSARPGGLGSLICPPQVPSTSLQGKNNTYVLPFIEWKQNIEAKHGEVKKGGFRVWHLQAVGQLVYGCSGETKLNKDFY